MNKHKALIVDDEPKLRKVLQLKLAEYCPEITVMGEAENIETAYQLIIKNRPEIIFLDIAMPGGSGFDLLDKFDDIFFEIIFVTGFNDYALDALKVSAVDYLLKPIITQDLIEAVQKAKERISNRQKIQKYQILKHNLNHLGNQEAKVAIPGANSYDFIKISQIIHCEGWQKYTKIHLTDGACIISSYNIGVFKDLLSSYDFFVTHKSHLINTRLIKQYLKEGTVVMNDGSTVPVSRRRKEVFLEEVMRDFLLR